VVLKKTLRKKAVHHVFKKNKFFKPIIFLKKNLKLLKKIIFIAQRKWDIQERSVYINYAISLFSITLAAFLSESLLSAYSHDTHFLVFLTAIIISSWFGGLKSGILATVLATLIIDYYHLAPTHTFFGIQKNGAIGIFLLEGFLVSLLNEIRIKTEKRLRQEEKYYHAIGESIPFGIFITNAKGGVVYMSQSFLKLIGKSLEEIKGFSWVDKFPAGINRDNLLKSWKKTIKYKSFWDQELMIPGIDGKLYHILSRGVPIRDSLGRVQSWVGINLDISHQKKLQEKITELANIVEFSDDAIIGRDINGIISSWNKGAEKLYGYKSKETIGKHITLIFPDDKREEVPELIEKIKKGQHIENYETVRRKKDGALVSIMLTSSPINDISGKIIGASTIATDITESKKLEKQKDDFMTIASHELKTPLTTVKVFNQIIQRVVKKYKNKEVNTYLLKMDGQINKLTELIHDLLDVSKIQSGKLQFKKEKINLDNLVYEVGENIQKISKNHKIIISGKIKRKIFADKDRIGQVLINLITNAIKYSPDGKRIIIKLIPEKTQAKIAVSDFGIGVKEEYKEKIFDRFFQVKVIPGVSSGMGMGLYICSEIVKSHNGKIWVESTWGKESTFYFTLPF